MKRAAKIMLFGFGGIALAVALVGWDTRARTARALRAHEERLAADIARLRARPTLLPLGPALPSSPEHPVPSIVISGGVRQLTYEMAHFGQELALRRYGAAIAVLDREGWEEGTVSEVLQKLAWLQESLREGGYLAYDLRRRDEDRCLGAFKHLLQDKAYNPEHLREAAGALDRILRARPSAREVLLGESALDREEILNWARGSDSSYWMLVEAPGWRELYSRSLLAAKALGELRDLETLVLGIESLPLLERESRAMEESPKVLRSKRLARSELVPRAGALFQGERIQLTEWALARSATALARFEIDRKRLPRALEELVPEYLAELPKNAYTGDSFSWDPDKGILETRPGALGPQSRWALRRP